MPTDTPTRTISILGCGWVGLPLARALTAAGHRVRGATTSPEKRTSLEEAGAEPFVLRLTPDLEGEHAGDFFAGADVLVFTVPPPRQGDDRAAWYRRQVQAAAQAARDGGVRHVLYTSSTGVYPPLGREVTEEEAASLDEADVLARASSRAVLVAEAAWQEEAARSAFDFTVVRLAGLYGPGREPGRFLAGKENLSEGGRPVNFVHRDDAVGVVEAVIEQEAWGDIFNACADAHPARRDFFRRRAEAAGMEPPTFADDERGAFKVVSNAKVKERLGYRFRHPDPMVS